MRRPGPAEDGVTGGNKGKGPMRLVEPDLGLTDVLLGLFGGSDPGHAAPGGDDAPAPTTPASTPVLRVRLPDGRVEEEDLLGGFMRRDRAGAFGSPRVVTLQRAAAGRGGSALHKLYRIKGGVAAYAGSLAAGGVRAFAAAPPGGEYRYRNAALRRMTAGELAAAVDLGLAYDFDLLGRDG